jgi:hypothetical protein
MENVIETIKYRGHEIKMTYDEFPLSPEEWEDDELFLVSYNNRELYVVPKGWEDKHDLLIRFSDSIYEGYYVYPVAIFSHSVIQLDFGNRSGWDWSNGWAFILAKRSSKDLADVAAQSLLEDWNDYLVGDVYCYEIDESDCAGGYLGMDGYNDAIEDARSIIDTRIEWDKKKFIERKKVELKHRIPLAKRTTWKFNY